MQCAHTFAPWRVYLMGFAREPLLPFWRRSYRFFLSWFYCWILLENLYSLPSLVWYLAVVLHCVCAVQCVCVGDVWTLLPLANLFDFYDANEYIERSLGTKFYCFHVEAALPTQQQRQSRVTLCNPRPRLLNPRSLALYIQVLLFFFSFLMYFAFLELAKYQRTPPVCVCVYIYMSDIFILLFCWWLRTVAMPFWLRSVSLLAMSSAIPSKRGTNTNHTYACIHKRNSSGTATKNVDRSAVQQQQQKQASKINIVFIHLCVWALRDPGAMREMAKGYKDIAPCFADSSFYLIRSILFFVFFRFSLLASFDI